jgi:hypothetical protein
MMLEMWFRTVTDREREVLAMVAASHNNTAIAAPGLPDRRHRDIRSTRRVRTAGRDGAGRRRCWRRTRGGVLCGGPPDQSRKQALDGRAGLARRSKGVGIDAGPFGLVRLGGILRRRWEGIRFEDESALTRPVGHPQMTLRPDCGAEDGTKARYALVCGDFRWVHRMGLIACSYRAAEWRHKEIELYSSRVASIPRHEE